MQPSPGGGVFLRELEMRSGLLGELAGCFIDRRDQRFVEHSVQSLISQRVNSLVLGYEDLNDHDELWRDPFAWLNCRQKRSAGAGSRQR